MEILRGILQNILYLKYVNVFIIRFFHLKPLHLPFLNYWSFLVSKEGVGTLKIFVLVFFFFKIFLGLRSVKELTVQNK